MGISVFLDGGWVGGGSEGPLSARDVVSGFVTTSFWLGGERGLNGVAGGGGVRGCKLIGSPVNLVVVAAGWVGHLVVWGEGG